MFPDGRTDGQTDGRTLRRDNSSRGVMLDELNIKYFIAPKFWARAAQLYPITPSP